LFLPADFLHFFFLPLIIFLTLCRIWQYGSSGLFSCWGFFFSSALPCVFG
jgi:hypothetical protein